MSIECPIDKHECKLLECTIKKMPRNRLACSKTIRNVARTIDELAQEEGDQNKEGRFALIIESANRLNVNPGLFGVAVLMKLHLPADSAKDSSSHRRLIISP